MNPRKEDGSDGDMLQSSLLSRLRNYFLAGILVTAPLGITIYLVWLFLQFMDKLVMMILPVEYNSSLYYLFSVPGVGLVISVAFFILVGWMARNFLGRMVIRTYEYVVNYVPVIRNIYGAIKQVAETIMASQSKAFREVILLEYPRKGVWSIGFVTNTTRGEVERLTHEDTINVFVPTTPNPTSGYLLFVPKKDVHFLDMTVEEGVKMVVSAGIITPPDRYADKIQGDAPITDDSANDKTDA